VTAELRSGRRVLVAVVAVISVSASAVVAGYIYAFTYVSSPVRSEVSIVAEDHARHPFWPEMGLMILCPSKARQMGLCGTGDERQLHAKYTVTVNPPPKVDPTVTWKVILVPEGKPLKEPAATGEEVIPIIDKSSDFTCSVAPQGEGRFELDLTFIADPDDAALEGRYLLLVTIDYDEPLLTWMPLFTRNVNGTGLGDLCLLGYHIGRHPPPGTPESEKPLGEFLSCEVALFWQRQMLGLEPSCEISACQWVGAEADMLSHVTVHFVDAYGKPIQNVTVWLNTTFCCWLDGTLGWTGQNFSETSDSDGNARFAWIIPYARYTVMIGGVVLSEVTGPPPTVSTTITGVLAQTPHAAPQSIFHQF